MSRKVNILRLWRGNVLILAAYQDNDCNWYNYLFGLITKENLLNKPGTESCKNMIEPPPVFIGFKEKRCKYRVGFIHLFHAGVGICMYIVVNKN